MSDMTIERAYKLGGKASTKFSKAAKYIVDHYVTDIPGANSLSEEARNVIAEVTAVDMATGAELIKKKYILIGVGIGIAAAFVAMQVKKRIKTK